MNSFQILFFTIEFDDGYSGGLIQFEKEDLLALLHKLKDQYISLHTIFGADVPLIGAEKLGCNVNTTLEIKLDMSSMLGPLTYSVHL